MALWAAFNLVWVAFDLTYLPLRTFWVQRKLYLYPIPSLELVLPLGFLPDITPWADPIKGIERQRETDAYQRHFEQLDASMRRRVGGSPFTAEQRRLLQQQVQLTEQMLDTNPFQYSGTKGSGTFEKIKNRLRGRASQDSARLAADVLLSPAWLDGRSWQNERQFWKETVLPLVDTNYWRSIDENGLPTDHFWRYDILLFQSVFIVDVLLKAIRLKQGMPFLSWRDVVIWRWSDLPLLLPFLRWLRVVPVLERLYTSGLIRKEPTWSMIIRTRTPQILFSWYTNLKDIAQAAEDSSQTKEWMSGIPGHVPAVADSLPQGKHTKTTPVSNASETPQASEILQFFISYSREDSGFTLKLAKQLRAEGLNLWIDQLDLLGGQRWQKAIESALDKCSGMIIILSPHSVDSNVVMDEVNFALEEGKIVVPILCHSCRVPFRLRSIQYIDFSSDYEKAFGKLVDSLKEPLIKTEKAE